MYRQIFKCTDKTPKKHYGGGAVAPPAPPPPPPSGYANGLDSSSYDHHVSLAPPVNENPGCAPALCPRDPNKEMDMCLKSAKTWTLCCLPSRSLNPNRVFTLSTQCAWLIGEAGSLFIPPPFFLLKKKNLITQSRHQHQKLPSSWATSRPMLSANAQTSLKIMPNRSQTLYIC